MLKISSLLTAVLVAATLGACASSSDQGSAQREAEKNGSVVIENKPLPGAYLPKNVTVKAGSVVVFENKSSMPHNVVFKDASLKDSPLMKTGESFSVSFPVSGEFPYVCTLHPVMQGVVSVR